MLSEGIGELSIIHTGSVASALCKIRVVKVSKKLPLHTSNKQKSHGIGVFAVFISILFYDEFVIACSPREN